MLARLRVEQGDTLYFSEAPDGAFRLTPYDPLFEEDVAAWFRQRIVWG